MNNVDYIKDHVGSDLCFQPELQQKVAKTLLALLKIRNSKNYFIQSFLIVAELEKEASIMSQLKKNMGEKSLGFVTLHETKKATSAVFPRLTDKEAGTIKGYLEDLLPKKEKTLEQYMVQELGLSSKEIFNPDDAQSSEDKTLMAGLAMMNAGNLEDFILNHKEHISDSKIAEIIRCYYSEKGYEMKEQMYGSFVVEKDQESFLINVSNYDESLMVSVVNFPF